MLQDSVPAGSYNDPFLSSVISMVTPTWCHGAIGRQPFSGWMMTVLTSELTHFNLVIHLVHCNSWPCGLSAICDLCAPDVPGIPVDLRSFKWNCSEQPETSVFAATFVATRHHVKSLWKGRHTSFRCGLFSFWLSGEVKHIVHLIRWNLEAVLCPCGWLEHGPGAGNNRTTFRNLGTESWFNFSWFHQLIPIGPLSHALLPPQVGWLRLVLRSLLVFALAGWFRRFRLPPPPLVLVRVRRPLRFFLFPLPFQGLPAPG